jgi:hypothetical protein
MIHVHVRLRNSEATGRILTPDDSIWVEAGRVRVQWDDTEEITHVLIDHLLIINGPNEGERQ